MSSSDSLILDDSPLEELPTDLLTNPKRSARLNDKINKQKGKEKQIGSTRG